MDQFTVKALELRLKQLETALKRQLKKYCLPQEIQGKSFTFYYKDGKPEYLLQGTFRHAGLLEGKLSIDVSAKSLNVGSLGALKPVRLKPYKEFWNLVCEGYEGNKIDLIGVIRVK